MSAEGGVQPVAGLRQPPPGVQPDSRVAQGHRFTWKHGLAGGLSGLALMVLGVLGAIYGAKVLGVSKGAAIGIGAGAAALGAAIWVGTGVAARRETGAEPPPYQGAVQEQQAPPPYEEPAEEPVPRLLVDNARAETFPVREQWKQRKQQLDETYEKSLETLPQQLAEANIPLASDTVLKASPRLGAEDYHEQLRTLMSLQADAAAGGHTEVLELLNRLVANRVEQLELQGLLAFGTGIYSNEALARLILERARADYDQVFTEQITASEIRAAAPEQWEALQTGSQLPVGQLLATVEAALASASRVPTTGLGPGIYVARLAVCAIRMIGPAALIAEIDRRRAAA